MDLQKYFNREASKLNSIDLFSGCGGLTEGLHRAGFDTKVAVEIVDAAVIAYRLNHTNSHVIQKDIRNLQSQEILDKMNGEPIHLLAGCPPCQGFSSIRRLNKKESAHDDRNSLVLEYLRLVRELRPLTIMMENVPGLKDFDLFKKVVAELEDLGYRPKVEIVNVRDYGVPQSRKRLVMIGSLLGEISLAEPTRERVTVRDVISNIESVKTTSDPIHRSYPNHNEHVMRRIRLTPKNGGSRRDLPIEYRLKCHEDANIGFNDVYGRLRWDDYSSTITGGCLNPSKGRFLHPEEDRCISAREAALLQSFPIHYKFPTNITRAELALLIGNALPPKFSYVQSLNIKSHIEKFLKSSSELKN